MMTDLSRRLWMEDWPQGSWVWLAGQRNHNLNLNLLNTNCGTQTSQFKLSQLIVFIPPEARLVLHLIKCEQCDISFDNKNGLRGHTNKKHGGFTPWGKQHETDLGKILRGENKVLKESLSEAEESNKELLRQILISANPTDTTCLVCCHEFYDPNMLSRHNVLYSWRCLSCGEFLKFKEYECCKESCTGAEHRVPKWYVF